MSGEEYYHLTDKGRKILDVLNPEPFMGKCMVCGGSAQLCAPLTFCDECKRSKAADEIRKRHEEWFKEIVTSRSRIKSKEDSG